MAVSTYLQQRIILQSGVREAVPTVDKSAASVATALFKVRCDKISNNILML